MIEPTKSGGERFIVENSDESWTGLSKIQDWTEIANGFDITTGHNLPRIFRRTKQLIHGRR